MLTLIALAGIVAAAGPGLAGCGSSDGGEAGTLRATYATFPDSLDPARSVTAEGWTAMQNTYLPLLTYAHANGAAGTRLIPALAKGLPKIDEGGRRYTLFLRPGLRYSDGTPVRASDFPFAVERLFRANSPGSPFYTGHRRRRTVRGDRRRAGSPGIRNRRRRPAGSRSS